MPDLDSSPRTWPFASFGLAAARPARPAPAPAAAPPAWPVVRLRSSTARYSVIQMPEGKRGTAVLWPDGGGFPIELSAAEFHERFTPVTNLGATHLAAVFSAPWLPGEICGFSDGGRGGAFDSAALHVILAHRPAAIAMAFEGGVVTVNDGVVEGEVRSRPVSTERHGRRTLYNLSQFDFGFKRIRCVVEFPRHLPGAVRAH